MQLVHVYVWKIGLLHQIQATVYQRAINHVLSVLELQPQIAHAVILIMSSLVHPLTIASINVTHHARPVMVTRTMNVHHVMKTQKY
jgi:hypothetical protein